MRSNERSTSSFRLSVVTAVALVMALAPRVSAGQTATYALSVSRSANRSSAIPLQGSTLSGMVYVFTSSAADPQQATPAGISRVCFWLDDPAMARAAARCEGATPYDFAGSESSSSTALAMGWDTTSVANGSHTITQLVTTAVGTTESASAVFTIGTTPALPTLVALAVSPATVTGGQAATGTVTLDVAAPSGGTLVALTSDSTAAQVPAGVTVASGDRTASFAIATTPVAATTVATLAASSAGVRQASSLTVTASQGATYALSVSRSANRSGAIPLQGSTLSGTVYVFTSSAADPQQATPAGISRVCFWLDDPAMARAAARCEGGMPYDFAGSASSSSTALALAWDTTSVANGSHTITQLVTTAAGTTESASAVFTVGDPIAPPALPALAALAVSPAIVTGGQAATGTVTLDVAAPSGGTLVTLTSDSVAAQVPAGVTVAPGNRTASFAIATTPVAATTVATLAATCAGVRQASLTIAPPQGPIYAVSVSQSANRSGAIPLQGSTVTGTAYVFTSSAADPQQATPAGISRVCFWLDDPAMARAAARCEGAAPYDFAGSVSSTSTSLALPWDTTSVTNGFHTITQLVTRTTGEGEVHSDELTIQNTVSDVAEPTVESASKKGPFAPATYAAGIPLGESYVNPLVYFPSNGTPPYPGVVFVAGYCETYESRAGQGHNFLQWGTLLASHGIVVLFVDSGPDGCGASLELALTEGLATLVSENARPDGPLLGKLDTSRLAVMGHSTGGGAALDVGNDNVDPRLRTAVGLTPIMIRGFYPDSRVPSLLIAGEGDPKLPNSLGQYESIPATTPKLLAEFAPVSTVQISMHHIADTPLGTNVTDPVVARIGLSYLKVYLADDVRYRQFLVADPSMSTFLLVP